MTDTAEQVKFPGPGEIEGFWAFDKMHAPRPLHPLSQDLVMSTLAVGFTKAQDEVRLPRGRLEPGDQPLLLHVVPSSSRSIRDRGPHVAVPRHARREGAPRRQTLDQRVAAIDQGTQRVGTRCRLLGHERHRTTGKVRRHDRLDDRDVVHPRPHQLRTAVWRSTVRHVHRGDAARRIPPSRTRSCRAITPVRSTPPTACGGSVESSKNSPALHQLFDENHPRDLAAKLAETDAGRAFLDQLNDYLYDFGWRSDAVYDIADVPWRENPAIPLGNIARYINMPDSDDPMIQYERAVKHREDLTAKIRAKLADDPAELATFDKLFDAAQYAVSAHRGSRLLHRPDGRRVAPYLRAVCRRCAGS